MSGPALGLGMARRAAAIGVNQAVQLGGAVLFLLLVPRALGPAAYGRLAYAFALIVVFQALGELGYQEVFARFLPEARAQGGEAAVRRVARGLVAVKAVLGPALGLAAALAAKALTGWLAWPEAALIGLAVTARVWAMAAFPLLLGLGQVGRWSVEATWRPLVLVGLLVGVVRARTLPQGLAALALHEAVFLLFGVWWARDFLLPSRRSAGAGGRGDPGGAGWGAMLRVGLAFGLANLGLVALFRLGPAVVEWLTGSSAAAGFFDLAAGGLLWVYALLGQLAYAFVGPLATLRHAGRDSEADGWLGTFVRWATVVCVLAAGGMQAVASPVASAVFGPGFEPAGAAIRAMAWGLLPLPVAWGATVLGMVEKRALTKVRAALVALAVFGAASWFLRGGGAEGVALAFGLSMLAFAAGFGGDAWRAVRAGGWGWLACLGAGLAFGLLGFLPPAGFGLLAWGIAASAYAAIVLAAGGVRPHELRGAMRALRGG